MLLRSILIIFIISLNACGFTPVYKQNNSYFEANEKLASVKVNTDRGLNEQYFSSRLNDLLNPTEIDAEKKYDLNIKLSVASTPLAIQQDRTVTRYKVTVGANYTLKDKASDNILSEGTIQREGGFDKVDSNYATYISEEDSKRRVTKELAEDMKLRIISVLLK